MYAYPDGILTASAWDEQQSTYLRLRFGSPSQRGATIKVLKSEYGKPGVTLSRLTVPSSDITPLPSKIVVGCVHLEPRSY